MAALIAVSVGACSQPHELDERWQSYQASLSELTEQPAHSIALTAMPIMPRSRDVRIEIERLSIGLLDSLRLERCRLGQIVAQRNSALGHAQAPSARLRYELDSLLAIEECLHSEAFSDERISDILNDALTQKRATLPLYIDQVLTRSEEFRSAMRGSNHTHPITPADDFDRTYAALAYFAHTFNSALEGRWQTVDLGPYNAHMQTLARSDFLSRHWRTMQRSAAWLDEVNRMLGHAVTNGSCQVQAGAEAFESDIANIFGRDLQPILTRWVRYQQALAPVLHQLKDMSVQGQWRAYVDELIAEGSHAEQVDDLTRRHVMLLEQTISACGDSD